MPTNAEILPMGQHDQARHHAAYGSEIEINAHDPVNSKVYDHGRQQRRDVRGRDRMG
jgi:hypothetical protein